jgi:8-oxo-dGTP diphosphatase
MSANPHWDWVEARGLLRDRGGRVLILRRDAAGRWDFPGDRLRGRESPESALRRFCADELGVRIDISEGQPPLVHGEAPARVAYRYSVCTIERGEAHLATEGEIRWVLPGQLRDYVFEAAARDVVEWLLSAPR